MNYILGMGWLETNLLPFQVPYDSSYWEALLKGSLEGNIGPADVEVTLRGGFIFAGYNNLELTKEISSPGSTDMDGDGNREGAGTLPALWKMDTSRHERFIGGGFSVLFDL